MRAKVDKVESTGKVVLEHLSQMSGKSAAAVQEQMTNLKQLHTRYNKNLHPSC